MASVSTPAAVQAADRVAVKRQPQARDGDGDYTAPALEHVGNEIDALLAVRLDPTQDEDHDDA